MTDRTQSHPPETPVLRRVREGVIGAGLVLDGPYGARSAVYADWTATGRSIDLVEDWIRAQVLPRYANTHTESSATGAQTGLLREDARAEIAAAVGADAGDAVVFCGSGATAAIHKPGRGARPAHPVGGRGPVAPRAARAGGRTTARAARPLRAPLQRACPGASRWPTW
ncbi:hypothetical protein GCM10025868_09940 [Angustibacter aerolatus]|uniref:Aminotransferase class V domain-containing protein n=1 Tax=Angustibacter aerolatus TaxID=1162965 RepID=A0ABQ6JF24_9ACTN|nr:aminotransferase class V-fold PLP-dependent enzyme [Angustibacter aerolatus]GMA85744.1 hypothetical protein GCM10025868_09940 [Angustibacter aerolatus]